MGAAEALSDVLTRSVPAGLGPTRFFFEVSTVTVTVPAVMDLLNFDALRAEQRLLRTELARLSRRLRLELVLEFATDLAIVLVATSAVLVFLDWLLRFGVPVRLALLALSLAGAGPVLRLPPPAPRPLGPIDPPSPPVSPLS